MSDVYALAIDGFLARLGSLRIHVNNAVIKTVSTELSTTTRLRMSKLETFDLYLKRRGQANEGEEYVKWTVVETLTSYCVMPRLRRFSLVYDLSTSTEIRHIFESSLFNNEDRHIRVPFVFYLNASTAIDSSDITNIFNIRSSHHNELLVKHVSSFFILTEKINIELKASSFIPDLCFRMMKISQQSATLGVPHHGQVGRHFGWIIMI
jgi:hypothetical protein